MEKKESGKLNINEFNSVLLIASITYITIIVKVLHCILKIIPHKFHPQELSRSYSLYLPPTSSCLILFLLLQKDYLSTVTVCLDN